MYGEDAHLEMMFEDRQGSSVDTDPDAGWFDQEDDTCPACGEVGDCPGHSKTEDPEGYAILQAHEEDDHSECWFGV